MFMLKMVIVIFSIIFVIGIIGVLLMIFMYSNEDYRSSSIIPEIKLITPDEQILEYHAQASLKKPFKIYVNKKDRRNFVAALLNDMHKHNGFVIYPEYDIIESLISNVKFTVIVPKSYIERIDLFMDDQNHFIHPDYQKWINDVYSVPHTNIDQSILTEITFLVYSRRFKTENLTIIFRNILVITVICIFGSIIGFSVIILTLIGERSTQSTTRTQ